MALSHRTVVAALLTFALGVPAGAAETFRIGTGETGGSYHPIGETIAAAISGSDDACDDPMDCGVPGLTVTAVPSAGSVANVEAIGSAALESGIVQSDVATWAQTGTGLWDGRTPVSGLRAIATLHSESIHIVTRAGSGIATLSDLRGKRVSPGEAGSGTAVDATLILAAWNIPKDEVGLEPMPARDAAERLAAESLDAFFFVGGYPAPFLARLAETVPLALIPIAGPEAEMLAEELGFLGPGVIPAETYPGIAADTQTLALGAEWVTRDDQPEALIYAITRALWNDRTRMALDDGPSQGPDISIETALDLLKIPLHPGAERYYREVGLIE